MLLSVTIIDDKIPEDKKNFTLTINPSSLPRHVNVGNLSQATVTIMDNDDDGDGNYYVYIDNKELIILFVSFMHTCTHAQCCTHSNKLFYIHLHVTCMIISLTLRTCSLAIHCLMFLL